MQDQTIMKILFVSAFALVIFCQTVNAKDEFECYKCGDAEHIKTDHCPAPKDDKFSNWQTGPCKSGKCKKVTLELPGHSYTVTGCANKDEKEECDTEYQTETCICNEHLCNGAFKTKASIVGMIMLITFSTILFN